MSVAYFVAIFVCSLNCEPRVVYLRPGGGGGIHSWIHTLFNVIHNIKELKVSVKDVLQGLKTIRGLCNSHDFAKNFNQVAPKPSKHLEQATQQVVSEAPSWKICEQLTGLGEKTKTNNRNNRLKSWNNRASCQEKRRMTRGFRRHSQERNLNHVLLKALKGLWVVISISKPKFQVSFVTKTWRNKTNDNVAVCHSLR